jgi:hypothetical protein
MIIVVVVVIIIIINQGSYPEKFRRNISNTLLCARVFISVARPTHLRLEY